MVLESKRQDLTPPPVTEAVSLQTDPQTSCCTHQAYSDVFPIAAVRNYHSVYFIFFIFEDFFLLLSERGRERERSIHVRETANSCLLVCAPDGIKPATFWPTE